MRLTPSIRDYRFYDRWFAPPSRANERLCLAKAPLSKAYAKRAPSAIALLVLFWMGMLMNSGEAQLPSVSGLIASINEKMADLHLKVRTTELPTEKSQARS